MLRVIDDFLDDPYSFRNGGLKLYNENKNDYTWPGFRAYVPDFLEKKYISKVESTLNVKLIVDRGSYFQWVDTNWISGLWHEDLFDYTILTFLNLNAPPNTGIEIGNNTKDNNPCIEYMNNFNSPKVSFYKSSRNYYQRYWFKKKIDKYISSPYFKNSCTVSNKFNRTVIFNRGQLHRAQNFFGKGKNARFTMISFCNVTT
tara:strand:+ start:26 stop:628 length:603 start_codon:yes stop_codon:yes gene_type:complete